MRTRPQRTSRRPQTLAVRATSSGVQFTVPVTRQARPRRPRPRFLPSAPASGLLWIASPIRRYYYCGLRRRGLLWIASSIRRYGLNVASFYYSCELRRRFVDMDWIEKCVLLVTLTLVLCFLCALLRVSSLWHVLCCKFTMVSQPYCVWVLDKGVDVGS